MRKSRSLWTLACPWMMGPVWRPEVLLPLTFLAAIVVGAFALMLPGMHDGTVGLLEAFFTATSAVCVTGLIVVDTGTAFTPQGQGVVLLLIQLGGLGIMTFSVLAMVIAGRRVSLQQAAAIRDTFTPVGSWSMPKLLAAIFGFTLVIEAIGFWFLRRADMSLWESAFHSVSAFCNAGFSLWSTSLQDKAANVLVPCTVLFVIGGLGFTTLLEIARNVWPRRANVRRFSLHARIVLVTTVILWGGGTLLLTLTEGGDVRNAWFMAASTRTAGFDSTPVDEMSGASLFIMIPMMFIGASPGSTGGGVKTTTLALAVLLALATLRGQDKVKAAQREIPRDLTRRMFAVLAFSAVIVFVTIFLLNLFEGDRADRVLVYAFEAVSAFATVGLSTGVTPDLSTASKVLLCIVMFIGRIGSLSLFVLLVRDARPSRVRYPEERIQIG